MLMMRLQRVGRRNDPSYRVVVTDKRTGPKSNKHVGLLGSYNPKQNHVQLDSEAIKKWLAQGVQPSPTVHNILVSEGIIDAKKINVLPKKTVPVSEEGESAEATETVEDPVTTNEPEDSTSNEESANESEEESKNEEVEEKATEAEAEQTDSEATAGKEEEKVTT